MIRYQEKKITVNDAQFVYLHNHENTKTPLLFLHGALADSYMWHQHMIELEDTVSPIALSLRHFGGSAKVGNFGIETHANDVIEVIRKIGCSPLHLVAWSYGADVALLAVLKAPELFRSLFLYELGYPSYLTKDELALFMVDAQAMFGPLFALIGKRKLTEMVEILIDGSGNQKGYFASQPEAVRMAQLAQADTVIKQLNQNEKPDISVNVLGTIKLPVHVAYGEYSRPLFQLVSVSAARNIPNCQSEIITGMTHMFPIEQPAVFSARIKNFIRNV
ncbi:MULTISPECIES: alpha/beta fold hydrolase [Xenorhabdus]|uniref:Acyl-CoA esterase n=1 Tax=Xenorhabdus ehlersii TaxID=290111 RepID=A0A2D0IWP9_9GAMM|nr:MULTISPECIES: alpha/beta hydrolase [Xenorhabdus]MBC8950348.1 acyl-CoA esterase [Xenorhabdus sp. TS4]PHM26337.1 acyl-CoA esterase [Xenorhabdus ehlersii]RKE91584.1 pimeloyl-ACP methyl ester carboxylesterase [Xenorhabdus ehlersii]